MFQSPPTRNSMDLLNEAQVMDTRNMELIRVIWFLMAALANLYSYGQWPIYCLLSMVILIDFPKLCWFAGGSLLLMIWHLPAQYLLGQTGGSSLQFFPTGHAGRRRPSDVCHRCSHGKAKFGVGGSLKRRISVGYDISTYLWYIYIYIPAAPWAC